MMTDCYVSENSFGIPGKEQSSTFLQLTLEQETFIPQNL